MHEYVGLSEQETELLVSKYIKNKDLVMGIRKHIGDIWLSDLLSDLKVKKEGDYT